MISQQLVRSPVHQVASEASAKSQKLQQSDNQMLHQSTTKLSISNASRRACLPALFAIIFGMGEPHTCGFSLSSNTLRRT